MNQQTLTQSTAQTENSLLNTAELSQAAQRWNHALGPIGAGLLIDLVDLSTFGPMGLIFGLPIGGLAGYWLGTALKLDRMGVLFCTVVAAIYCAIPFTEVLPLGTIVGALIRFQERDSLLEDEDDDVESCA